MIQAAQLNVPAVPVGVKSSRDVGERPATTPENGGARWAARARVPPTGPPGQGYLIQASTLPRLASTHFFAAASGVILSTAMYLATVFWSSLVQLNFFTRS